MADSGVTDPHREMLDYAEQCLSRATLRLGRLRSRNRDGPLRTDLTALLYDLQAARHAVVAALEAGEGDKVTP